MLFKVRQGVDVFEDNPGLTAVEQYAKLTDQQMKAVILICDPSKDNPIRSLSGRARRERAAIIAGYKMEPDGKRLDKNGRNVVYGQVPSIEHAIEEFKKNHYDEKQHSIDALKQQIAELREFLVSDKRVPLTDKKGLVLNSQGKEIYITDLKALKMAVELGPKIADLEEALDKLESLTRAEEPKFEGVTGTAADLGDDFEENSQGEGSTLDKVNEALRKNDI